MGMIESILWATLGYSIIMAGIISAIIVCKLIDKWWNG